MVAKSRKCMPEPRQLHLLPEPRWLRLLLEPRRPRQAVAQRIGNTNKEGRGGCRLSHKAALSAPFCFQSTDELQR